MVKRGADVHACAVALGRKGGKATARKRRRKKR